ncbi:MAG: hypothetical protein IKO14_01060 [Oscillibacter sp.]|nr:hypothetical protein [Oscillibacter sp.]
MDRVKVDLLIIHLDGDVSRNEDNRIVHCMSGCPSARNCQHYGQKTVNPLSCDTKTCPVKIPCPEHAPNPDGYTSHLSRLILDLLKAPKAASDRICPVIICDSMEAWIISAYDKTPNPEAILNPYETVIAKSKAYHGLRIHRKGNKKDVTVYREFLKTLKANWEHVKTQCPSAQRFEDSVCHALQIAPAKSP